MEFQLLAHAAFTVTMDFSPTVPVPFKVISLTLPVSGKPFSEWRIPGVLQRFSITYFVVAITELFTSELYAKWKVRYIKLINVLGTQPNLITLSSLL